MSTSRTLIAALAVAGSMFALSAPASAQEATPWPELMMKMADKNKDGTVTRQEFLDAMAKMWDEKHAQMMKADPKMKAGMMAKGDYTNFIKFLRDPGQIGG